MGPWDEVALESLAWHWGEAYAVSRPEPDVWLAQRRDTREMLRAGSAEELRDVILADYVARPVSRDVSRGQ
jgi:hypothetical protein